MGKCPWVFAALAGMMIANTCEAYRILVMFPFPAKSHCILGESLVKHLLQAGHEVTYITAVPIKNTHPKLQQIDVSANFELLGDSNTLSVKLILDKESKWDNPLFFLTFLSKVATNTFENPNVVKLLSDPKQNFDLVIDEYLLSDLYSGVAAIYNCPLIWFISVEPQWMLLSMIDEGPNPAYAVDHLLNASPPFSFLVRSQALIFRMIAKIFKAFWIDLPDKQNYERIIAPYIQQRGRPVPSFDDVRYNASMVLGNSHVSIGQAISYPQNCKHVGGYHVDNDIKPLTKDLKNILDNAKNGLIYFSMGSNLESKSTPDELKRGLLKIFGELKQTVLWKFEEALPDSPPNVHIVKWAPQQSILAHPNCVLFITHGGFLSTIETVHFGKPIIGVPAFGDQFNNVDSAVKKGYAKRVDLSYSMVRELKEAIIDILQDPKYTNKAKELSMVFHDRPVTPAKELIHWVEHVVRTKGAPHLRSPALHVPFYQKCYLDLLALVLILLFAIKIFIKRIISGKGSKTDVNMMKKIN